MRNSIKKIQKNIVLLFVIALLGGCGKKAENTLKVGINGSGSPQWEHVKKEAKKENIDIEIVYFSDYVQPNRALVEGDIDLNSFQTLSFLKAFNEKVNNVLVPVATTALAPMGIYSKKLKDFSELADNAVITIPNDPSNQGRALKLLAAAGLITLKPGANEFSTNADILTNPKSLVIKPLAANQLPQTLHEVSLSTINNGIASDAGYRVSDAIFAENELANDYINVIATRKERVNDERINKIITLFQTDEVKKIIESETKNNQIVIFKPLSELGLGW